jgi:hypothetical protein
VVAGHGSRHYLAAPADSDWPAPAVAAAPLALAALAAARRGFDLTRKTIAAIESTKPTQPPTVAVEGRLDRPRK